ncbi:Maf family protein [Fuscovulum blasticum]|uniref:Maf family protein n=1 Tax=Fuscovulum blasticum TaxID=1075 RepID=UPI000D3E7F83|nr:nucleoside triphosphate pyrophosphatase [Fuscovulum blasticum]AWD22124.1 septum formation protein Maf [Fuscovulum blasticum]
MLILASASETRAQLLRAAGVPTTPYPARVDEEQARLALLAEDASPRDLADALAEMKARKVAERFPEALVLGCDQILEYKGTVYAKPETPEDARAHLTELRGRTHKLMSAAVLYEKGRPVWRTITDAHLTMRDFSDAYRDDYLARNWDTIRHSVGGYRLEEEGVRLFSHISGDHFTILGLPLIPLLSYLGQRGIIPA